MSAWIKAEAPAKPPASPRHIDIQQLYRHASDVSQPIAGVPQQLPRPLAVLVASAPQVQVDRWGIPLPITAPQQARLDRIGAILADAISRPRALLRAGQLGPDEVGALIAGRPAEYAQLLRDVERDMVTAGPPLAGWMESQLAILFQRPSAQILSVALPEDGAQQGSPKRGGHKTTPFGTPSDRREIAVRQSR